MQMVMGSWLGSFYKFATRDLKGNLQDRQACAENMHPVIGLLCTLPGLKQPPKGDKMYLSEAALTTFPAFNSFRDYLYLDASDISNLSIEM